MIVELVVPYKVRENGFPLVTIFKLDLADMVTLVDWHNSDATNVLEKIQEISISSDERGSFYLNEDKFTKEGLREYLKRFLIGLEIQNSYYYVDLVNWNKRPPRKLASDFDFVNFIVIEYEYGFYRVLSSVMVHYKDVGTREVDELKEKLGIKQLTLEERARYKGDEIEKVVQTVKKKVEYLAQMGEYPVLVYRKEHEAQLREALRGTDLYDELFQ